MRINSDFEEHVAREFLARRAAMTAELATRPARTPAGHRGVAPAVPVSGDEVHISPEARATSWAKPGASAGLIPAFPSPAEVAAALRTLVELPAGAVANQPLGDLARLLSGLATGLPGNPPPSRETAATLLADTIVRILLGPPPQHAGSPALPTESTAVLQLARELVAAGREPAAGQQTSIERATAALLLGVLRWRGALPAQIQPEPRPASGELPAALLSLVDPPKPGSRRARRRTQPNSAPDPETDPYARDDEPPANLYRSSPRRT